MKESIPEGQLQFSRRQLIQLIWPLVVEQFLAVTIGMADTMMVASTGEAAVAGIGLVDSINLLLIQVFSALATGGAVVASQYIGHQERDNACRAAKQLLYASTALSLVIMVCMLSFNRPILSFVFGRIEEKVMANAETYFWLSAVSYPFLAIYNAGAALFRTMGNSRVSMLTSLMMNIVNICGNALLIFVFRWGVAGAATASLVSRMLGAVIMLILVRNRRNPIYIEKVWRPEFHRKMVGRILKIGVPNGVENGMFQVGKLMVAGLVSSFATSMVAANTIAGNISSMVNIPGAAIGLGMVTVVGQCVGAGEYGQAVRYTKKLMAVTYIAMGVLNVGLFFAAEPLVALFGLSDAAVDAAREILQYSAVFCAIFWPLSFTLPNALRASGDARFSMAVSMLSMWVFRIGFSYLLALCFDWKLMGVWAAMFIDWIVRGIVFTIRFCSGRWKSKRVI